MADALGSESSLLDLRSNATGFTYGHRVPKSKRRGLVIALFVITVLIAGVITLIYIAGFGSSSSPSPTPAPIDSYLLKIPLIALANITKISTFHIKHEWLAIIVHNETTTVGLHIGCDSISTKNP